MSCFDAAKAGRWSASGVADTSAVHSALSHRTADDHRCALSNQMASPPGRADHGPAAFGLDSGPGKSPNAPIALTRRALLLTATATLAACGFTPVYGPAGSAQGLRGTVEIDPPSDPAGFALVRQLERRLGQPNGPTYALSADLYLTEEELGITANQEITRYNLLGRARFALRDLAAGTVATSGEVESFSSYSATGTPFATQTAQRDAQDRLMVILADQIVARLLATAGDWR